MFPADAQTKEGQPFWSGPKRCPTPEIFSADDVTHVGFVEACANLIAFNMNIEQCRDKAMVKKLAAGTKAKPYVKSKIQVETPEEQKEREEKNLPPPVIAAAGDEEERLVELMATLKEQIKNKMDIQSIEFEKDDETNFHIDFIHNCAQVRARNYKISECDFGKTKMIAGRIIPAIATTTAMITGCVAAEFYKFTNKWTDLVKFKNAFINLALPMFMITEPDDIGHVKSKEFDPIMGCPVKAIPEGFTIYDKTVINEGSLTFQGLFDYLKDKIGIEISMVACGKVALYNAYLPSGAHKPRLQQKIEDVYQSISKEEIPKGRYYLVIEVSGECIDDGSDFVIPPVKYCFQ
jgi:ubiquitin-activating enzyme E1